MNRKELRIRDLEKLQNIDADSLVAEYGYRAFKAGSSTRMKEIYTKADYIAASVRQQLLKNGISVSSVKLQPDEPLRMSGEVIAASNDGTVFHGRAEMIGYRLATGHIGYNIFGMPHALYLGTCTPQKLSVKRCAG